MQKKKKKKKLNKINLFKIIKMDTETVLGHFFSKVTGRCQLLYLRAGFTKVLAVVLIFVIFEHVISFRNSCSVLQVKIFKFAS